MKRKPRNKPKRDAAPPKRIPKGDSIKTTTKPRVKRAKRPETPVDFDGVDWRIVLTIKRANELTDIQRYAIVNWLRAKANDLGGDEFGHNLAPVYRARMMV